LKEGDPRLLILGERHHGRRRPIVQRASSAPSPSKSPGHDPGRPLGGVGHVLRLTFDAPAPAAEFDATLVTTP
jgi:hypothetical protein